MSSVIRIGTRESKLAMWQAEHVHALLQSTYPEITFESKFLSGATISPLIGFPNMFLCFFYFSSQLRE